MPPTKKKNVSKKTRKSRVLLRRNRSRRNISSYTWNPFACMKCGKPLGAQKGG